MNVYREGQKVAVRVTNDGVPICPLCNEPMVEIDITEDGTRIYQCQTVAAAQRAIRDGIARALDRIVEDTSR